MIRVASLWLTMVCLLCGQAILAQNTKAPRPISWKDVPSWRSISGAGVQVSPDGKYFAYALVPVDGDGELLVQKNGDTAVKRYPVGGSSFVSMGFSEDGKWLAYKEAPKSKDQKAAQKSPGRTLFSKLILVELATDKKTEIEKAGEFAFNGEASSVLAVTLQKERAPGARPDDPKGSDLLLVDLSSGKQWNMGNVGEFSFNKNGQWLAYTIDAAGQAGNGVSLFSVANRQVQVLHSDKANFRSLTWTEEGNAFALLKMTKDEKFKQEKGSVIGVKNLGANPAVVIYQPAQDSLRFPRKKTISPNRAPMWTEDLTRLLFGIHDLEPVKKETVAGGGPRPAQNQDSLKQAESEKLNALRADTSIKSIAELQKAIARLDSGKGKAPMPEKIDTVKPDMTIWNWQDKRLQSRQQVQQNQDKNFYYWALYDTRDSAFRQLNDSTVRSLSVLPLHQYALATDNSAYELDGNLDGQQYMDFYLVDMNTGKSAMIMEKMYLPDFMSYPRPAPNGKRFVYGKDGHYYLFDIPTRVSTNLTAGLPTSFVDTEDDHNVKKPLTAVIGWSADSRYVLIRDLWDVWQIPVEGKDVAVNLTRNGKKDGIRYQSRFILDFEEKGIDLKKPQYFRMYGEWTKKSGIARVEPGKNGLAAGTSALIWEDMNVGRLTKAKKADAYVFSKERANQPPEFYASGASLADARQITQNAPDKSKYLWSAGAQLVNYVSDKGDSLQGALFLPAGYEQGKKYPTLVYYYEKLSQTLHSWSNPGFSGTGWNPTMYTSNGYAVFIPDIVYKMDDPGMSAVWCVLPGVKAAIATGVIDPERIGIHGHSWGGYQTSFLITQTNMFKAAAAGAPLTNMVSMYDLIYWNSGGGNMSIFEASQGRFTGAPWENWEAYLRNSPVYHVKKVQTPLLMLHNDKDGAVDFTQGIEYFNALRRLKKPVVMVQYKGENHGLSKLENRKDYSVRMMEFFDYYLKGAKAPDWWEKGVDALKLSEHLDSRVF